MEQEGEKMKILPSAETYQKEYKYFPWGKTMKQVIQEVNKTPKNGSVLDLMCGTGYALGEVQKNRKDLKLTGLDNNKDFIKYAKKNYKNINFIQKNALSWKEIEKYECVICTGGIHHINYKKQELVIKNISKALKQNGIAIIADPFIGDYKTELERKIKANELGCEYTNTTLQKNPPLDIIHASIDITRNDVIGLEFKSSTKKIIPIYKKYFKKIKVIKKWPMRKSDYGDYIILCGDKK